MVRNVELAGREQKDQEISTTLFHTMRKAR